MHSYAVFNCIFCWKSIVCKWKSGYGQFLLIERLLANEINWTVKVGGKTSWGFNWWFILTI